MLVLSRLPGQKIVIDGKITIFGQIVGGKIKFFIDAPEGLIVDRQEVHRRRQRAARPTIDDLMAAPEMQAEREAWAAETEPAA